MDNPLNLASRYQPCFYRVSIKGVIQFDGKLVLTREHGSSRWDLPGGGVEHYEDPKDAFKREIKEELGVEVDIFGEANMQAWFMYDSDPGWERPILYLVVHANVTGLPKKVKGIEVGFFSYNELTTVALEKHLERFRQQMIDLAFKDN